MVAFVLLSNLAKGVERALLVGLVDCHQVGEVEHVDLLELGAGPIFRRHHVHRQVGVVDYLGVRLPDTRRLQDHQVITGRLDHADRLVNMW